MQMAYDANCQIAILLCGQVPQTSSFARAKDKGGKQGARQHSEALLSNQQSTTGKKCGQNTAAPATEQSTADFRVFI